MYDILRYFMYIPYIYISCLNTNKYWNKDSQHQNTQQLEKLPADAVLHLISIFMLFWGLSASFYNCAENFTITLPIYLLLLPFVLLLVLYYPRTQS